MFNTFVLTLFLAALAATGQAQILAERNGIINGTLLKNIHEFSHHVTIYTKNITHCSGSILTSNWILTAASCVGWSENDSITLMFNTLNVNISHRVDSKSFRLTVSQAAVTRHNDSNLALIHLPVALEFNNDMAPIALALNPNKNLTGLHAVLPGIKQNTTLQAYGNFEIISNSYCSSNKVCTLGYRNDTTVPCSNTQGGGLLIDWPWAPRLVGVFSDPLSCLSHVPAAHYRVSHYISWISEIIGQRMDSNGYFFY